MAIKAGIYPSTEPDLPMLAVVVVDGEVRATAVKDGAEASAVIERLLYIENCRQELERVYAPRR